MFRRLLVANRGEIANRIILAAKNLGIEAVAVVSAGDEDAPYLEDADEVVKIGPASADRSYLNADALLQAAEQTNCQALHPGYGFLSENAVFAERCRQQKISFIGPGSRAIRLMGDKSTAKATMKSAGLPMIPGSDGNLEDADAAAALAGDIGYPVLLKATAGGGGRGMRVCRDDADLRRRFEEASVEAGKAFGNSALYMEKYIERSRHIEFQVLADRFGDAVHLGERECSIQRKHQKLVEEAPSPVVSDELRAEMGGRIVDAVRRIGYQNAGTVEMLMDAATGELYFIEMNTRLQVEHPVTEMVTGIDLVAEQIRIAANHPLSITQTDVTLTGHSIECRINAEDPAAGFAPAPGTVKRFQPPAGAVRFRSTTDDGGRAALRVDSHVRDGTLIPPYYDSMIAKLISYGSTRAEAVSRMQTALTDLVMDGPPTTVELHKRILSDSNFQAGDFDTGFLTDLG
jgi:acetyl-CoA carboxylase biotin carboxylase subunit